MRAGLGKTMVRDPKNPLGMVPDPYAGDTFVLPNTLCTDERRSFFRRANEILAFLSIDELALRDNYQKHRNIMIKKELDPATFYRLQHSDGRTLFMPVGRFVSISQGSIDILYRQGFVMLYGSFETYLFELIERSFVVLGVTLDILDKSLDIMMKRKWDGKFCKMKEAFWISYSAGDLCKHFDGFEMEFDGKSFKHPFLFLDEIAQVRHKIIHASSLLEKGKLIFVDAKIFHAYFAYFVLLTEISTRST
jgi:hypothetical protein